MKCWKCSKNFSDSSNKVGFRAVCPHCDIDQHVCKNCKYYTPGKPNNCAVPGTDFIRDPEAANFCEEFKIITPSSTTQKKQNFNSLFKDEEL